MMLESVCVALSRWQFKEGEHGEDEIVVEKRSLLQRGVPAVQPYSTGERTETLTLFRNEVAEHV